MLQFLFIFAVKNKQKEDCAKSYANAIFRSEITVSLKTKATRNV